MSAGRVVLPPNRVHSDHDFHINDSSQIAYWCNRELSGTRQRLCQFSDTGAVIATRGLSWLSAVGSCSCLVLMSVRQQQTQVHCFPGLACPGSGTHQCLMQRNTFVLQTMCFDAAYCCVAGNRTCMNLRQRFAHTSGACAHQNTRHSSAC